MSDILTYSAAKAEAEKQRLLAETYKAEAEKQRILAETYKEEVMDLKRQLQRAAACGMTVDKYLRMKEDDKREREALQAETDYGKRLRLARS
jgi:hypothetical protein